VKLISLGSLNSRTAQICFLIGGSTSQQFERVVAKITEIPQEPLAVDISQSVIFQNFNNGTEQEGFRKGIIRKVGALFGFGQTREIQDPFTTLNKEVKQLILVKNSDDSAYDSCLIVTGNCFS